MRRENRALCAQVDIVPQICQAKYLVEKIELILRRNELGRVENIVVDVRQHNVEAEA